MMRLSETVEMMNSEDYKERFKAEFFQLKIRVDKLSRLLSKLETKSSNFTPKCSIETLENQLIIMRCYMSLLELMAKIEGIEGVNVFD